MKKIINAILITLALGFMACGGGDKTLDVPDGILDREEFKAVLIDFQLAEAAISEERGRHDEIEYKTNLYYYSLFKKHGITRKEFEKNIRYYTKYPEEFTAIYEEVINELSKLQGKVKSDKK
jgi:DNA-binding transcriptional ArsR family regulator